MSILHWNNGVGGDFSAAANWDLGLAPTAADVAVIDAAGVYSGAITGADTAQSLTLNDAGATVVDSGSLTIGGALTSRRARSTSRPAEPSAAVS